MNKCKITAEDLVSIMSFGKMPIANGFIEKKNFDKEFFFEMEIGFNEKLSLLQLIDHPKPEVMFNRNYPFFTSSSKHMISHFKNYSQWINQNYGSNLKKIIEIGSNDGTFLKNFNNTNIQSIGFEPSLNVSDEAIKQGINSKNLFFNLDSVEEEKKFQGQTDIICAANVICHIPDLENLFKSVNKCLNQKGLFIFEEPYLGSMFEKISYDQIYDEHIFVFSVTAIDKIFKLYDLQLVDVQPQITHGGSMRYIIKRKNIENISSSLKGYLEKEKINKIDSVESALIFKKNCETSKIRITEKLKKLKSQGKKICGYAATSKSTTILNYCNINSETINYICDTTNAKIGKFTPGTHIPIVDMSYFYKNQPDSIYLFAWNHKEEILEKEKNFKGDWFSHVAL